jgi:hypothetical protein
LRVAALYMRTMTCLKAGKAQHASQGGLRALSCTPQLPSLTHHQTYPTARRCYAKCSSFQGANDTSAPNDPNTDAMATILAHEIVEITSDPYFDAWYDERGYENADICIWRYSNVQYGRRRDGRQYKYTAVVGGRPYLIQDNFDPSPTGEGTQQKGCVSSAKRL